jgi:hypothetical protein
MGDVVVLDRATAGNFFFRSSAILPAAPHPRTVTISIKQARAIDRDIRHLDAMMARTRDVAAISIILSTIYGPERLSKSNAYAGEKAARVIGMWLRTGQIRESLGT